MDDSHQPEYPFPSLYVLDLELWKKEIKKTFIKENHKLRIQLIYTFNKGIISSVCQGHHNIKIT